MRELLKDRYEPLEAVAKGGEALVSRGWDHHDDRPVALKAQRPGPGQDQRGLSAEARVLMSLRPHPGLPVVRDHFAEGGREVLVMDWIEGADLARVLHTDGAPGLPREQVLEHIEHVAAALDHLHAHDPPVVHGDVKPANLILTEDDSVVLVDFGIATGARSGRDRAGTRGYTAPEVAAGGAITPAADVYGLAATTVTLLTGSTPTDARPDWAGVSAGGAGDLEHALGPALSIDPAGRPRSAQVLVAGLRALLEQAPAGVALAFGVSDAEGLWDRHPDAMPALARRFAVVARDVMRRHGGVPVSDVGTEGVALFPNAMDALGAAIDLHGATDAEIWPSGMLLNAAAAIGVGDAAVRLRADARSRETIVAPGLAEVLGPSVPKGWTASEREGELVLAPTAPAAAWTSGFVGRGGELLLLEAAVNEAVNGRGGIAVITGDPGIGKTRLVEETATRAARAGVTVLWGRCYESGTPAFWPWTEALRTYIARRDEGTLRAELGHGAAALAQLVPELVDRLPGMAPLPEVEPDAARFLLYDAVARFLAAAELPVLIVFDDLHWADASSVLLLQFVAAELATTRAFVVGTYRESDLVAGAVTTEGLHGVAAKAEPVIALGGLEPVDIGRHVANTLGFEPPTWLVPRLASHTAGNPFFVSETVRLLKAEGGLDHEEAGLDVPDTVRAVVRRRLERLGPRAVEVLSDAAVLGEGFDTDVVEWVTGDAGAVVPALAQAAAARMVEPTSTPGRFRFTHALIRETLYDGLDPSARARRHWQCGEALERLRGEERAGLDALAHHFTEGAQGDGLPKAVDYARRAGVGAVSGAGFEEGAGWFQRALEVQELVGEPDPRTRAELLLELGDARTWAADREGAASAFITAAGFARRLGDAELFARLALAYGTYSVGPGFALAGQDPVLVSLLEEALDALDGRDEAIRARVQARLASALYRSGDRQRLDELSREAIETAERLDDRALLVFAYNARHVALYDPGYLDERLTLGDEIVRIARAANDPYFEFHGLHWQLIDRAELGDMDAYDAIFEGVEGLTEDPRVGIHLFWAFQPRCARGLHGGRLEQVEQLIQEMAAEGARTKAAGLELVLFGLVFVLRLRQGRLGELRTVAEQLAADDPETPIWSCAFAMSCIEADDRAAAATVLERLGAKGFEDVPRDAFYLVVLATLAEVASDLDDRHRAGALYTLLLPYRDRNVAIGMSLMFGAASRYLGRLAVTLGRWEEATEHFEQGLEMNGRLGDLPELARTQYDFGRLLLERGAPGDRARADGMLADARSAAERYGLAGLTRRIEQVHST